MKSHSYMEKNCKAQFKANESSNLSDAQLSKKFGIRKCFVELDRLKSCEACFSKTRSCFLHAESKLSAKNKFKKSNSRFKEKCKIKHLDSKITKNGIQNSLHETLEKDPEDIHLPERNKTPTDLSAKNKNRLFENQEEADKRKLAETDLTSKRRTRSSSNSSIEIIILDSDVKLTDHDATKEIKLSDKRKRNKRIDIFSNVRKETQNLISDCSEIKIISHNSEEKVILDSEIDICDHTAVKKIKLSEKRKVNKRNDSSSNKRKETEKLASEYSEVPISHNSSEENQILDSGTERVDHKAPKEIKLSEKKILNKRIDSFANTRKEIQNLIPEGSEPSIVSHISSKEIQNLDSDIEFVDPKIPKEIKSPEKRKVNKKIEGSTSKRKENKNLVPECFEAFIISNNSSREIQSLDSEVKPVDQNAENKRKFTERKRKNKRENISSDENKETHDLVSGCSSGTIVSHNPENKVRLTQTKRKKKPSTDSRIQKQNLDSDCSKEVLSAHKQTEKSSILETDFSRKSRTKSSFKSCTETQNFNSECLGEIIPNNKQAEETNKVGKQNRKKRIITNSKGETQNFDSKYSEMTFTNHEQTDKINQTESRKRRGHESTFSSSMETESESSELVCSSQEQGVESNLTETDLPRKTRKSSDINREIQIFESGDSKEMLVESKKYKKVNKTYERKKRQRKNRSSSISIRRTQNVGSESSEILINPEEAEDRKTQNSETTFIDHKQTEEITKIEVRRPKIIRNTSNICKQTQNFCSESSETVLSNPEQEVKRSLTMRDFSRRKICSNTSIETQNFDIEGSEKVLFESEHKKLSKPYAKRSKWKKSNRNSSFSNRETQNLDPKSPNTISINIDQTKECNITETDLIKRNITRSSSSSNSGHQNFNSNCPESFLSNDDQELGTNLPETELSEKIKIGCSSDTNRGTQNFDSECSEQMLANSEHLKKVTKTYTRRSRGKKSKRKFSNSNREAHNLNSESSGIILNSTELSVESNLTGNQLSRKTRTRSSSNLNNITQNFDSKCLDTAVTNHEQTEEIDLIGVNRRKKNESTSNLSKEMHNFHSESSETMLPKHDQKIDSKLTETDSSGKGGIHNCSDTSKETKNFDFGCSDEIIIESEHLKKVTKTYERKSRQKKSNRSFCNSNTEIQNLSSESSGIIFINPEEKEGCNLTRTEVSRETRTSPNSNSESHYMDSEYSETDKIPQIEVRRSKRSTGMSNSCKEIQSFDPESSEIALSTHNQDVRNVTENDLSSKIEIKSLLEKNRGTENFSSGCSAKMFDESKHIKKITKTCARKSRQKINRSFSNSKRQTKNLDSKSSDAILINPELTNASILTRAERARKIRTRSSSNSKSEAQNIVSEHSETPFTDDKQIEEIAKIPVRRPTKSSSTSNSSKETQSFDSESSEIVLSTDNQDVESNLTETYLRSKIKSPTNKSQGVLNLNSGCSEEIFAESEDFKKITKPCARRCNQKKSNRGPTNSNRETQNLNSKSSGIILINNPEQTDYSILTRIDRSRKTRTRSFSNSNNEAQNINSEYSATTFTDSKQIEKPAQIEGKRPKRSSNTFNSSKETQSFDSQSLEIALAIHDKDVESNRTETDLSGKSEIKSPSDETRETQNFNSGSEETFSECHHFKKVTQTCAIRNRQKKNRSSSNSKREIQNLDSKSSGTLLLNTEQTDSILTRANKIKKTRTRSSSNSNSEAQNIVSEYSETVFSGSKQIEEMAQIPVRRQKKKYSHI